MGARKELVTRIFSGTIFLSALICLAMQASAQSTEEVVALETTSCALRNNRWVPGRVIRTGKFKPYATSVRALRRKIRNKRSNVEKLGLKLARLKKKKRRAMKDCGSLSSTSVGSSPKAQTIKWSDTAFSLLNQDEAVVTVRCKGLGSLATVYGTNNYHLGSSVCSAAVHMGIISLEEGGSFRISKSPASIAFFGFERNGVRSEYFFASGEGFVFVDSNDTPITIFPFEAPISWDTNAEFLNGNGEQHLSFYCPAGGNINHVTGTNFYSSSSSICSAAVHVGAISPGAGGSVTIRTGKNFPRFFGMLRNGVQSNSWLFSATGFDFLETESMTPLTSFPEQQPISWTQDAASLKGFVGEQFDFFCSPNGSIHRVVGTGTYLHSSSICSAAVHSGLITVGEGGHVRITIVAPVENYDSTKKNEVVSEANAVPVSPAMNGAFSFSY